MTKAKATEKYRQAAMRLYGISRKEADKCIRSPKDDPGEWAPESLAIIYLEYGYLPINYWSGGMFEELNKLSDEASVGYVECINPGVCAVYK